MAAVEVPHFVSPALRTPIVSGIDYLSPASTARRRRGGAPLLLTSQNTLPQNDDAAEKKRRYISGITGRDLQSPTPNSPRTLSRLTESERSKSSSDVSSLNNAQVTDIYAKCIQLSAENKITVKNAFNLNLIDLMQEVVKTNQSGHITNFQVASCTLDAGRKIYAGRVDSIHQQTFKMLGGLGRADTNHAGDDENGGEGTQANKRTKKIKQHQPGNAIESNINNMDINKLDLEFEVDPVFNITNSSCDEGGSGSLLLNNLQNNWNGELLADSSQNAATCGESTAQISTVDLSSFRGLCERITCLSEPVPVCPYFTDFNFTNWDASEQDQLVPLMTASVNKDDDKVPVFNMDDSVTEFPPDIQPDDNDNDMGGEDGEEYDDFDVDADMGRGGCHSNDVNNNITLAFTDGAQALMLLPGERPPVNDDTASGNSCGELYLEMSSQPDDYGYFRSMALATWAGPEHWKMKQRLEKYKGTTETNSQEPKQRKKKEKFFVDFNAEIDFNKSFTKTKAATTMAQTTVAKMCESNITLPSDKCDQEMMVRFTMKKQIKLMRHNRTKEILDDDADWYNYNNPKDQQNFCPDLQDDVEDDSGGGFGGGIDFSQDTTGDFTQANSFCNDQTLMDQTALAGDNLVAEPNKVQKIVINYSKTAKRLNVKKLKYCMWNILTDKQQDKENVSATDEAVTGKEKSCINDIQSFGQMYKELPNKVSSQMAKNLSVPIAFVCLLHLANEKILSIKGCSDMSDFMIEQDVTRMINDIGEIIA